jgi:mRNA-degrading endonuclease RelE of RelBE toxin-antitoxin system
MAEPYDIRYSQEAVNDLVAIRAYDQRAIIDGIEQHLINQPRLVSRSRIKEMLQPFWSQYRLRIEDFRVYYDVDDAARVIYILRVLSKGTEQTPESPP